MTDQEIWHFLYKELLKLNNIVFIYDKIFINIEINNNRYNSAFQLLLDSFTRNMAVELTLFFDERKNVYSLYNFTKINQSDIDNIKKATKPFLLKRHNQFAHLSKKFTHTDNFSFFTKLGIDKIKEIIKNLHILLQKINNVYDFKEGYLINQGWGGVNESFENIFYDLTK